MQGLAHELILFYTSNGEREEVLQKKYGAVVDHCGHENTRVFREVTEVGEALNKLKKFKDLHQNQR